jgi:hypothetical protein
LIVDSTVEEAGEAVPDSLHAETPSTATMPARTARTSFVLKITSPKLPDPDTSVTKIWWPRITPLNAQRAFDTV